jgi:hypothetical protein
MSPELTNIVLVAAGVLGVVILTIGVVAFIKREVRPKIATPEGLIRPPGDRELKATRDMHPPTGKPTPIREIGCHWCARTAVWRDMVKFSCDVHRVKLYRGGKRAHRLRVDLGDGSVRVGHDIIHPGKPIGNGGKHGDQAG